MKIMVTGISGIIGRMVTHELLKREYEVIGVDRRPWPDAPDGVLMHTGDIRKRPVEDLFRTKRPDAVIHMATVTHFTSAFEERYRINLHGTRAIFEHCHNYGVKQAIFVGRHTVYGAASDAPLYHNESEPPLAASTFPALADMVAADLFAGSALWRWPELKTAVLRLVYPLGSSRRGTLASYLSGKRIPTVLGFDPLYQFMHEQDAAMAIVRALEAKLHGVYNVTGPMPVPLSLMCEIIGKRAVGIPEPLFARTQGHFGFSKLPAGALNHVKYPVVVDGNLFREATGFEHHFDEIQTLQAFRWPG